MNNINMIKSHTMSYSHIFINQSVLEKNENYNILLISKLKLFSDMIKESYTSLMEYTSQQVHELKKQKEMVVPAIFQEIFEEYTRVQKKGIPVFDEMVLMFQKKRITKADFELFCRIIEHQEVITKEIITRDIAESRLEVYLNHLKDSPYYLKYDLDIESLPNISGKKKHALIKISVKDKYLVRSEYDGNVKKDYKKKIA